ncbi:MAG: hypothetical protein GF334_13255 [Candidatus Altiarchaeales archaeon]|nr:hypothetical protein [Candidatus Altiarchaeales archaeon]
MAETGIFLQGHRLKEDELDSHFYSTSVYYPSGVPNAYSPYWIRYEIGWVDPDTSRYHRMGSENRIPYELDTGHYRANFIIGDLWPTGTYEIRWKYKIAAGSTEETKVYEFYVETAGIFDGRLEIVVTYNNLVGTLNILPDYQDLPGSFTIVP